MHHGLFQYRLEEVLFCLWHSRKILFVSARGLFANCSRCDLTHKKDSLDTSVKAYMNLVKDKDKEASSLAE